MAQLGKHLNINDNNEIIQNALITFNSALVDIFERKLFSSDFKSTESDFKTNLELTNLPDPSRLNLIQI